MHFSLAFQVLGLILTPVVLSSPLSERNSYICQKDSLYGLFHQHGMWESVEEFCCSHIHYPTSTVTVHSHPVKTVTRTIFATKDVTTDKVSTSTKFATKTSTKRSTLTEISSVTIYVTSTATSLITTTDIIVTTTFDEIDSTITSDITSTTSGISTFTSTYVTTSTALPAVRKLRQRANYPWNKGYNSKQLSSACSCLSLSKILTKTELDRPSTSTKTVHAYKTKTVTSLKTKVVTNTRSTTVVSISTRITDVSVTLSSITTIQLIETDSTSITTTSYSTFSTTLSDTVSTETDITTTSTTTTYIPVYTPVEACTPGSAYTSTDGVTVFARYCYTNFVGYEAESSTEATLESCMDSCAGNNDNAYGSCVGVSYDLSSSICSFKYGILVAGETLSTTVLSARIVDQGGCIDGVTQWGDIFLPSSGNSYTIFCAINDPGYDTDPQCTSAATSTDDCGQQCTDANIAGGINGGGGDVQCVAAAFVPHYPANGNCCLKTAALPGNFATRDYVVDTARLNL